MLGRLLNTAASAFNANSNLPPNSSQLESVTDEEHTHGLLYPGSNIFQQSQAQPSPLQSSPVTSPASNLATFDDKGGWELDETKDLRVIVAQNATGDRDEPYILLDTHNLSGIEKPTRSSIGLHLAEQARARHSRNSSLSQVTRRHSAQTSQSSIPHPNPNHSQSLADSIFRDPSNASAFNHVRSRRSTFSSTPGLTEHYHGRLSGDNSDSGLLNCIFGSSAFTYRGSSTKMHIIPAGRELPYEVGNRDLRALKRRSHLQRSETFSSGAKPRSIAAGMGIIDPGPLPPTKITVLVTRMFSVNLPESKGIVTETSEPKASNLTNPSENPDQTRIKKKKMKEKKTPMFAVAIVVQLPITIQKSNSSGRNALKPPGLMSTSLDSGRRWNLSSDNRPTYLAVSSNLDERIDTLVEHWDVITRTLSQLEKVASKEILLLLKQADLLASEQPKLAKQPPNMQRTNQKVIHLSSNCLSDSAILREESFRAIHRVSMAFKIPRVVTGQSCWGVWRDEARWVAKFLNEKERNFFFLVLITAFLGNHTDWLGSLGPEWHRRRYILQQRTQQDHQLSITHRTVICSPCKTTARRLVFILSAFLPAQPRPETFGLSSPLRPSTSTSLYPMSQSPPAAPVFRRDSLRRTLNKRAHARNFIDERGELKRSASVSSSETTNAITDDVDFINILTHPTRRDSDVRSITASLPIPVGGVGSRKSSVTIAAPMPHFDYQAVPGSRATVAAPASKTGTASANLMQTLRRSESTNSGSLGNDYQTPSKWGNLLSTFWGSNKASSPQISRQRAAAAPLAYRQPSASVSASTNTKNSQGFLSDNTKGNVGAAGSNADLPPNTENSDEQSPASPVKLCVEANDGVVDVEVPLPGFLSLSSSNDSAMISPRKSRTSITSFDGGGGSFHSDSFFSSNSNKDNDKISLNVAGWLKRYHEDFVLQGVRPYMALEADVKRSMSAEPTPSHILATMASIPNASDDSEKWVDVCSTLIADTTSSTVKRIRLRRRLCHNKAKSSPGSVVPSPDRKPLFFAPSFISESALLASEHRFIEEEFIEEPVMDLDGTLVDAVERVLVQTERTSAENSRGTSPTRYTSADPIEGGFFEIPRNECRRMVLGALEEVVRSVTAECRREDSSARLDDLEIKSTSRSSRNAIGTVADNTLREGIRKWLFDIEETF